MTLHRYGLLSDTHGHLHPGVFTLFEGVEAIYHAGDVCGADILVELEAIAPTFAVQGNCDTPSPGLPPARVEAAAFGPIAIAHGHLVRLSPDPARALVQMFRGNAPRVILFGHTHRAFRQLHDGVWVINPGPAGRPRLADIPSVVVMTWDSARREFTFEDHRLEWRRP